MLLAHGPMLICPAELAAILSFVPGLVYVLHRIREYLHV